MASSFEFREDTVEEFEFAGDSPNEIVGDAIRIHRVLNFFEDKWMIANLLQLHHRIVQATESLSTRISNRTK